MLEKIHLFHTNDLHSHFEYWLRMQVYIKEQRLICAGRGEPSFLLDVGDHMDRSNVYTEATLGKGNVRLLNEAGYDVVTIGNNEGITLSYEELCALYEDAAFDVVVANINAINGENPAWLKPYTILQTKLGTTIAVIGATAQFDAFYRTLNWEVTEPRAAIILLVQKLRAQVDIIVCLSHLGITDDELLAKECPDIDVIFGAHTHHKFPQGKWENGVLLTGGGKFGQYTGHTTITYNHTNKSIVSLKEELIENGMLATVQGEDDFVYHLAKEGREILNTPVIRMTKTYYKEWFHYSPLSDLFARSIWAYTNADCVMFNAGIFLDNLQQGYTSAYDLHKILPHPINLCTIELTGAELKEMYLQAQNEDWPELQLKGLGFRGIVFGKVLLYGIKFTKQRELLINGKRADMQKTYTLATLDLFTFGYFFPSFKYAKKHYYLPAFLRDIFMAYLQNRP
ncbi:bifunctional metallophosphatase/5'-nucleotidase [Lysinibacillus sp. 54212]|uniref:bifunctional metallophosphatase/5'-nucleotidase n=1 Tax=Lysinibacillus sp. 54212 TaxID=3119829 RepID=UPI002FCACC1B